MKKPVPGCHGNSYQRVLKTFSPSKGAGKNGIMQISRSNRNNKIRSKREEKDNGNDEKRFGAF
jgi:hypothetical protein